MSRKTLLKDVSDIALPLEDINNLDPLIENLGNNKFALLGEASHGTHEYYAWRREITKRLISEKGFNFIGVEGDWPDCYRVNRYVKGYPDSGGNAYGVLHAFSRWPTWMWANWEVVEFVEWLKTYNQNLPKDQKVGFYGLDVYSLWESLHEIIEYLKKVDPSALKLALQAFRCFEPYAENPQIYARATAFVPTSCEDEVVKLLQDIQRKQQASLGNEEEDFNSAQNALVIKDAEHYYRTMIYGGADSWNIRDTHMMETLKRITDFYQEQLKNYGKESKGIVWAHNTHVGDARFTDMGEVGMINIGQLAREKYSQEGVQLVGFGSFGGSVIASVAWEEPMRKMIVPSAKPHSWEEILHHVIPLDKLLIFAGNKKISESLFEVFGHRAIGVVYNPVAEAGNYVASVIPQRYDAFLYFDETRALKPLHLKPKGDKEWPETFPFAV